MSNIIFTETNARIAGLPGFQNCDYGAKEARQALAIQDAGVSGGGSSFATGNPVVGAASASYLAADDTRTSVIIQNLSVNDVYINFGVAASLTDSLKLVPDAEKTITGILAQQEIFAIASAGGSQTVYFTTGV